MSIFVVAVVVGLIGLGVMALPGLSRHGHGHSLKGHVGHGAGHAPVGHAGVAGKLHAPKLPHGVHSPHLPHGVHGPHGLPTGQAAGHGIGHALSGFAAKLVPEPRSILSILTLFGASGMVIEDLSRLSVGLVALVALAPALFLEWAVVGRLWKALLRFQGRPASPMEALLLEEAEAVTAFRNGKGFVRVIRDGRAVQLVARLAPGQPELPIRVGDRLRISDVDPQMERIRQ